VDPRPSEPLTPEPVVDPDVPEAGRWVGGRLPTRDVAARMPVPSPIDALPLVDATLDPLLDEPLPDAMLPPAKPEPDEEPPVVPPLDEPAFD
jgi:hypothetical protein